MISPFKNSVLICAASIIVAFVALQPQTARAQQTPLSYEQKFCIGMGGVVAGTMEMVQSGGRSWSEIQNRLVNVVRQAGWPLNQADFDKAVEIGLVGVRGGDNPRDVSKLVMRECLQYAWYSQ